MQKRGQSARHPFTSPSDAPYAPSSSPRLDKSSSSPFFTNDNDADISFSSDYDYPNDQAADLNEETLPLHHQPRMSSQTREMDDNSLQGGGVLPARRRVGAGGAADAGGEKNGETIYGYGDEKEEKSSVLGAGGKASMRKDRPAYRPSSKTWVRPVSCSHTIEVVAGS
jgi:hypothetical protein